MTHAEQFLDVVASVEQVLNKSFQGASLAEMLTAVNERIAELKAPAEQELEFDENSLELGILQGLLVALTDMDGVTGSSVHVH